ncbi:ATP-dependent endonuclease [Microbacterium esteraromaticum]|uniref:ATP-dependent endonuclease n=1 Tax=Microbacterium esteraromaticum TaxID=57043 RepID=UPI00195C989D|nr:ATP-dependent endonuclease [Microbacterium esteraromaticum]MBM7465886.1 hypothetical protein [Microbacterium esteraromaticum]
MSDVVERRSAAARLLVEGASDRLALQALARRRGDSLQGVEIVDLGGITNLRAELLATGTDRVVGLYDGAERHYVVRVLEAFGVTDLEAAGFFGCERDLEDEVIRAAGPELVLETLAERGELARFRRFQRQPAQRVRSIQEQLHRFAGTAAGRKSRFAADLIDVIPLERMPVPLTSLLDRALANQPEKT